MLKYIIMIIICLDISMLSDENTPLKVVAKLNKKKCLGMKCLNIQLSLQTIQKIS